MKLTWQDIITQNLETETINKCLREWSFLLQGKWAVIFLSKFGDWFLQNTEGQIYELSVIEGTFECIADSYESFETLVNDQEWQEDHLLTFMIYDLHKKGIKPEANESYAFTPHPLITGKLDTEKVMTMNIWSWQSICAQTINQSRTNGST